MPIRTIRVLVPDRVSVFTTGFNGLRVTPRVVGSDFDFRPIDFLVSVDASGGPITGTLPSAIGSGQWFYCKKLDSTANIVTIAAQSGDLIDDSISFNLTDQWSFVSVIDAAFQFWAVVSGD